MSTAVDISETNEQVLIRPHGDLDLSTVPRVRSALTASFGVPDRLVVVDLSDCELVDSAGLGLLLGLLRRAREAGHDVVLRGVGPSLARVLTLTGLDTVFASRPRSTDGDDR